MPQRRSADHTIAMDVLLQESLKSRESVMHWQFDKDASHRRCAASTRTELQPNASKNTT
jgi:hypothetical protein